MHILRRDFLKYPAAMMALLLSVLWAPPSFAADEKPAKADAPAAAPERPFPESVFYRSAEEDAKVDIDPKLFKDFWKNWHYVGVRWRQDIREFRLTYANDLAWKVLMEKKTDYPVGAMFGKLVYPAEEDLALPSSVLPSNRVSRFMVMRWDPKSPKAGTDGWIYVRYINAKQRIADKDTTGVDGIMSRKEVQACVECHNRAYDRGNVFSQPQFLFRDEKPGVDYSNAKVASIRIGDDMREMTPKEMPAIANDLLRIMPSWTGRKIMGYQGDFITGSITQLRPVLAKLVQQNPNMIYMIYDRDDPNTIQLGSSVKKTGHDNCAGFVLLRGLRIEDDDSIRPQAPVRRDRAGIGYENVIQRFRPAALFVTLCGGETVSMQDLPLLYQAKDKDGLPSYTFAPATPE